MNGRPRRRVVSVGAVRGVLTLGDGGWAVDNDSEVRLLEALRAERGARDRLWGLAAALDEGLVEERDLRRLNDRLSVIAALERREEVWRVRVPGELMAAVAYVCVCVSDKLLTSWLGYALSARLNGNLVEGLLPGPGRASWDVPHRRRWETFDRDVHWISELPESFWSRLDAHSDGRLRAVAVASDPTTRPKVLESLINQHYGVPEVLDLVASHPRTPTRVLRRVVRRAWSRERPDLRVAQSRSATVGLLRELANDDDKELRYVAAAHPRAPVSALRRLARDESLQVRAAVAQAVSAPVVVLEALASDRNVWVRRNAASNRATPRAVLEALLADRRAVVRAAAVRNKKTPVETVAARARDRTIKVRSEVAARGVGAEVLGALAADPKWMVRQAVAYNELTPPEVLDRLATDGCEEVRAGVAYNISATPGALEALARDEFLWARVHVALNVSTPVDLLVVLAADEDFDVRGQAAQHPAMPLAQLKKLATDEFWEVRAGVALNREAPEDLLTTLAGDQQGHVRRCVCENDDAPLHLVDALRSDGEYRVRAAAIAACKWRRGQAADSAESKRTPQHA
ncbi:MAG: HEAT repeat domain-containing protein [Acidimicrobiaceae bacterium]|nr:HEAT repeat domain-containing protein [Acidimicrobiaceae bacterium]